MMFIIIIFRHYYATLTRLLYFDTPLIAIYCCFTPPCHFRHAFAFACHISPLPLSQQQQRTGYGVVGNNRNRIARAFALQVYASFEPFICHCADAFSRRRHAPLYALPIEAMQTRYRH